MRFHCVKMASRAPGHLPGPARRYWYGVHGPKKHLRANTGSDISILATKKTFRSIGTV